MNIAISHPQYITDDEGHKTAVILPIDAYDELLEDLADLAAVADRRDEKTMPHDELLADLRANGLL